MRYTFAEFCKRYRKIGITLTVCLSILALMSWGVNDTLKDVDFLHISSIYKTIKALMPQVLFDVLDKYRLPLMVLDLISILFLVVAYLYKPRVGLVCHTSMSPDIATVNDKMRSDYYIRNHNIDLTEVMGNDIVEAINIQDTKVKSIITNRKGKLLGYYGVAHTPLIFRMGYQFGDQNNIMMFHKRRNNSSCFEEWSKESSLTIMQSVEKNKRCKSQELIVSIATTFEIKESALECLDKNSRHLLMFTSSNLSFDEICSYVAADTLRNQIMTKIREVVKKYGITTIHLAISSSVAFTFFLAAAFSRQHDPTMIVYHYDNGKYIWGINMSLTGSHAVVYND